MYNKERQMKRIGKLLMIVGVLLLSYALYQLYDMKIKENHSLKKAKESLSSQKMITIDDFNPQKNEAIGVLKIPIIDAELPIIEGTSEDELERGVGHYSNTKFPGQNDQILLSGHRDTVFRKMGDIKVGDTFIVELPYGTFTYEMTHSTIVPADDTSIIQSTAPNEELVISTCYPFRYIGDAPDRYILYAKPIKK